MVLIGRITLAYAGKRVNTEIAYEVWGRITPAYAGKSFPRLLCCLELKDHPHVCGEKEYSELLDIAGKGSPPRMRGKEL